MEGTITWNAVIIFAVVFSIFLFICRHWLQAEIKESVAKGYRESLEEYKNSLAWQTKRKEQASEVAELFSLWHKWKYFPDEQKDQFKYELQNKYWKLAIWLDAPLFRAINNALDQSQDENSHKEAMLHARKLIVSESDDISVSEITHFLSDLENKRINEERVKKAFRNACK